MNRCPFKYFGLALTIFVTIVSIRSVLGSCPVSQVRHAVQSYIPSCPGEGTTGTKEVASLVTTDFALGSQKCESSLCTVRNEALYAPATQACVGSAAPENCEDVVKSLTAMFTKSSCTLDTLAGPAIQDVERVACGTCVRPFRN